ncbi:hypothetical protein B9Z19DRAFT_1063217 [Tuber borchii]|uniref:HNH nuclease domain-containing protein n=1 Tax=Tuber borchii TaxID=42251 RepID=A0A2T6ZZ28_TUBBO|nr:hypothetical protein B9Z19DRAFT_1063217 [Tuber borchii]
MNSPPTMNYSTTPLHQAIVYCTSLELARTIYDTEYCMTREHQQELADYPPADTHECAQVIDAWVTRLKIIKSALLNFPTTSGSVTINSSPGMITVGWVAGNTAHPVTAHGQHNGRSRAAETDCLKRDNHQCIITGRTPQDGSTIEVAHIIPFDLANNPHCRDLDFWKMLDIFQGKEATDTMFAEAIDKINGLENLICLDSTIHSMFRDGRIILTPVTHNGDRIHIKSNHIGDYWLRVEYPLELGMAEFIQSTKGLSAGEVRTLYWGNGVPLTNHNRMPGHPRTLPLPSFFALRASIHSLKHESEYIPTVRDLQSYADARFTTPIDTENLQSMHRATSHTTSADPVLAASAILDDLVDSGDLARSP